MQTDFSSGVVASLILVSPGLDCLRVSLAEDYATCLKYHLWSTTTSLVFDVQLHFHKLQKITLGRYTTESRHFCAVSVM